MINLPNSGRSYKTVVKGGGETGLPLDWRAEDMRGG